MDKSKFTINPHLDSEGFTLGNIEIDNMIDYILRIRGLLDAAVLKDGAVTLHAGEYAVIENPPGWREVDGVTLPPITWAERV